MTKEKLIHKTIETWSQLPQEKIREVNDFADYILKSRKKKFFRKELNS